MKVIEERSNLQTKKNVLITDHCIVMAKYAELYELQSILFFVKLLLFDSRGGESSERLF